MKVLFIPYGISKAPATRYRVLQYLPYLKKAGIDYRVISSISFFSTCLMIKSPDFGPAVRVLYYLYVYCERLLRLAWVITFCGKFDIIFLQRTTFPLGLEKLLKLFNPNIIFDIDDAIHLPDKKATDAFAQIKKYIKKTEVVNILKAAKTVIVENDYIGDFVSTYCRTIVKIPGPIDTNRFFVKDSKGRGDVVIGWIGSPATTAYLHMLDRAFAIIASKYKFVRFKFIGLGKYENPGIKFESVKWNYETEVTDLQSFDIGIMPMPDNEWTRGKLGCKMLQYMAVGIPAVVSRTSTNAEIIKTGEDGFLVESEGEWIEVLSALIENEALRRTIGEKGRKTIVDKCSLEKNFNKLTAALRKSAT